MNNFFAFVRLDRLSNAGAPVARCLVTSVSAFVLITMSAVTEASGVGPTPTFAPAANFGVGTNPYSVAAADFNGDGKLDLAVANFSYGSGNTLSILLNTTADRANTPTYATAVSVAVGLGPVVLAAGDFNGDGKPDLVVADQNSNAVSVLLNTTPSGATSPNFTSAATFNVGNSPLSVAVADINGDGKLDVVVANAGDNTVSVLLNTTPSGSMTPSFVPGGTYVTGNGPFSVAVGDFNGDGKPDVAVVNFDDDSVSIFLNTTTAGSSTASLVEAGTFTVGTNPYCVAVGDFNGDGLPDLAVANYYGDSVTILLNSTVPGSSTAAFNPGGTPWVQYNPISVAVGDFNLDGIPDLAVVNAGSQSVSILLNTTPSGATTANFTDIADLRVGSTPRSVVVGDFNGDGLPDVAVANQESYTVSVLLNTTQAALVSVSPASISFGNRPVNTTGSPRSVTVTNTGSAPLFVGTLSITGTSSTDFTVQNNACSAAVAPNQACTISVTFGPTFTGTRSATLQIPSNALNGTQPVSLTGTGTGICERVGLGLLGEKICIGIGLF
jgi:hypothetical protein